jgi:hypothetical protein
MSGKEARRAAVRPTLSTELSRPPYELLSPIHDAGIVSRPTSEEQMQTWIDERVAELRSLASHDDEGPLWIMFFDDPHGAPVMATTVDDAMAHLDQVLLRNLAWILGELPAKAALFLIPRDDGQPRPVDRQIWSELNARVHGPIELLDLIVVGASSYWSAQTASNA